MFPIIQIGPLAIQAPGLILIAGFWIALNLSEKYASHFKIDPALIYRISMIAILTGVVGARAAYVIRNLMVFTSNPADIISLNPQMLDIPGGILAGTLAALIFGQRRKMEVWKTLDGLTPAFACILISLSIANLASGNSFGSPTSFPWAIFLWEEYRHPSQIIEATGAFIIMLFILPLGKKQVSEQELHPGSTFLIFVVLTCLARILFETFRGDSQLIFGIFRQAQIIAWFILGISLKLLHSRNSLQSDDSHYAPSN